LAISTSGIRAALSSGAEEDADWKKSLTEEAALLKSLLKFVLFFGREGAPVETKFTARC
jgi:hypothetical protein